MRISGTPALNLTSGFYRFLSDENHFYTETWDDALAAISVCQTAREGMAVQVYCQIPALWNSQASRRSGLERTLSATQARQKLRRCVFPVHRPSI